MNQKNHFGVIAIPLRRPQIIDFLQPPQPEARGAWLQVVKPRPTTYAESAWIAALRNTTTPTVADLLAIDDPHNCLVKTRTDRLVPVEFLKDPEYLTRNLGGWSPIYFNVASVSRAAWLDDPLLKQLELLQEYGEQIRYFGADPDQVAARLAEETGNDVNAIAAAFHRIHTLREKMVSQRTAYIERIYAEIARQRYFATANEPPIPDELLFDELLGQLVQLELTRREAVARGDTVEAELIKEWQLAQQKNLTLILKGEYIVGRHRSSIVLIAPELGVVIKQPAPEPLHEIKLSARTANGKAENWPYTTGDGALVTSRGRLRLVVEEDLVPRLNQVFGHDVRLSTLLGLIIEPFVTGKTVQEWVLEDSSRLTPELYDVFVLHQQTCEMMGIENGDWHSANFIKRASDGAFVHIDWGAARPLRDEELRFEAEVARLNQVRNIGFSFHDEALADQVLQLHVELLADVERLTRIRQQARMLAEG